KRDEIYLLVEQVFTHASNRKNEDTTNSISQGMFDRAKQLWKQTTASAAFINPEILALPQQQLEQYLQETPGLALYQHKLDNLNRQRPHLRSAEVEAILAAAGEITTAPNDVFSMINDADLKLPTIADEKGEEVALTRGNYQTYIRSIDRRVRK